MNGIILTSGQYFILNSINDKITSFGGLYVGLMTNQVSPERTYQTPSGIIELSSVTCSGYSRQLCASWTVGANPDPYIIGSGVTFTIMSGSWNNINGYFISESQTGNDCIWCENFPIDRNVVSSGNPILIYPRYYQY